MQEMQETHFNPWVGKIPWRRKWQPDPVSVLGKLHGQRNLAGHNSWGHKQSDVSEQLSTCKYVTLLSVLDCQEKYQQLQTPQLQLIPL